MNKPNGMKVIDYNNVNDILMNLDIGDFPVWVKRRKKSCITMIFIQVKICMIKLNLN